MSRGRDANHAYCVTDSPRLADTREGSHPAPELRRLRRLDREQAGLAATDPAAGGGSAPELDPVAVLAEVLGRDGGELSATETLERELCRADHLGVLGGIWDDLVRREQHAQFEHTLRGALPADLAKDALDDPACTWLWRSLYEAELAGLDGGDVLRQAVAARNMTGARDVAAAPTASSGCAAAPTNAKPPGHRRTSPKNYGSCAKPNATHMSTPSAPSTNTVQPTTRRPGPGTCASPT